MFIDLFKNNGIEYLSLAQSYRAKNIKGKTTTRRTVILNIGPLDKFDDGKPDYIERLWKSFKTGNPLVAALAPYCINEIPREAYTFNFEEGDTACFGTPKLFSYMLIERILEELGLMNFFSAYKSYTKIQYDVLILDAFNIKIPPKFYRRAELKQIKTNIEIFM